MSVLATVVPSVTPSVSPVVHAVSTVVVAHKDSLSDTINALAGKVSTADLLVAAGVVTSGVQYLVNHFANLRKTFSWLLSFVLPLALVSVASVVSGNSDMHLAPAVYLLSQLVYFVLESIKTSVKVPAEPAQF